MPWYKITIKKKNDRQALTGIRHFEEKAYKKVEKLVYDQTYAKLGKDTIDEISKNTPR